MPPANLVPPAYPSIRTTVAKRHFVAVMRRRGDGVQRGKSREEKRGERETGRKERRKGKADDERRKSETERHEGQLMNCTELDSSQIVLMSKVLHPTPHT